MPKFDTGPGSGGVAGKTGKWRGPTRSSCEPGAPEGVCSEEGSKAEEEETEEEEEERRDESEEEGTQPRVSCTSRRSATRVRTTRSSSETLCRLSS